MTASDKVKAAVDKVEKVVENAIDKVKGLVEVELTDLKNGFNTVFHEKGVTQFVDGTAKVSDEVAKVLQDAGIAKPKDAK